MMNLRIPSRASLLALSLVLLTAASCKRNETGGPESLKCDAEGSRLIGYIYTDQWGRSSSSAYTDGLLPGFGTGSGDTLARITTSNGKTVHSVYNIFSGGDHIQKLEISSPQGGPGDTIDTRYAYDAGHRLQRFWTVNTRSGKRRVDSFAYIWEDGNVVALKNLMDSGKILETYSYYPNTPGRNTRNLPGESARWLYRAGSRVQLSKDFRKDPLDTGIPEFDSKGRLTTLRVGGTYPETRFVYECR